MADLKCFMEDDRPIVYANIAGLMRAAGWCEEEANDKEALFSFEDYVRTVISSVYGSTKGSGFMSYWEFLIIWFVIRTPFEMDRILAPQPDYGFEEWRFRIGKILFHLMDGLGFCPLFYEFLCTWSTHHAHMLGVAEFLFLALGSVIAYIGVILTRYLDPVSVEDHSNIALCKLLGWTVFMSIAGFSSFEISKLVEGYRPKSFRKRMPPPSW